jgi:hypothetical protein
MYTQCNVVRRWTRERESCRHICRQRLEQQFVEHLSKMDGAEVDEALREVHDLVCFVHSAHACVRVCGTERAREREWLTLSCVRCKASAKPTLFTTSICATTTYAPNSKSTPCSTVLSLLSILLALFFTILHVSLPLSLSLSHSLSGFLWLTYAPPPPFPRARARSLSLASIAIRC